MLPVLVACLALAADPAELIVHNAKVVTLDARSSVASAVAVRGGKIVAVGEDKAVLTHKGDKTRLIDAKGQTVLPGLVDSHVHSYGVVSTELSDPPPPIRSLKDAFAHIKKQAAAKKKGEWIVLRFAFPTRLDEARFPTKAELDEAAPDHPVWFHAGPAGVANSMALKLAGVTRDTKNPSAGMVVKDKDGEPTGLLRNAEGVLKGLPRSGVKVEEKDRREGVKKLFRLYNEQGLTGVADRNAGGGALALYKDLAKKDELTVRVNAARPFDPSGSREQVVKQLESLAKEGVTGDGDDMVRIGPLKMFLDGGMLNGTAYMREPWPIGPTYQVTEKDYRGLLFVKPERLEAAVEEAAKRKWQVTAHCAGEAGMDVLLDAYEHANRSTKIKPLRFCITHANFPSKANLERCKELGVCADVQPAWLYKDGNTLMNMLSAERIRWFQPYKTWLKYTTIGGGSDHMLRYDSMDSTNPWNPWLAIWVCLTRATERGKPLSPDEALTREEALRLYTINNAYLHNEEKTKGTIEVGKLADLIVVDRDVLKCPVDDVRKTQVLFTIVGGKVVYERK